MVGLVGCIWFTEFLVLDCIVILLVVELWVWNCSFWLGFAGFGFPEVLGLGSFGSLPTLGVFLGLLVLCGVGIIYLFA